MTLVTTRSIRRPRRWLETLTARAHRVGPRPAIRRSHSRGDGLMPDDRATSLRVGTEADLSVFTPFALPGSEMVPHPLMNGPGNNPGGAPAGRSDAGPAATPRDRDLARDAPVGRWTVRMRSRRIAPSPSSDRFAGRPRHSGNPGTAALPLQTPPQEGPRLAERRPSRGGRSSSFPCCSNVGASPVRNVLATIGAAGHVLKCLLRGASSRPARRLDGRQASRLCRPEPAPKSEYPNIPGHGDREDVRASGPDARR